MESEYAGHTNTTETSKERYPSRILKGHFIFRGKFSNSFKLVLGDSEQKICAQFEG